MGGICGIFGNGDSQTVRAMLDTLVHRGPEDGFQVSGEDFVLGARRLSIIDVDGGRQPLSNESGLVWAVQNGELYNFPEVKQRLQEMGHQFIKHTDTEIIPHLYEEYGVEFPRQLDGMFAAAVWDDQRKIGVLARDRIGQKPLYYHLSSGGVLYFASEIKALLCIPRFERRINLEALDHYLSFKHVPHPLSIFSGISVLPPAHLLIYRPGSEPEIRRYWALDYSPNEWTEASEEEIVDELLAGLRRGVQRRLMVDVPIGFFLSGGVDSSLTTALAAELTGSRINTFTLTYAEDASAEEKRLDRKWARQIASQYDTEHFEAIIDFGHFPDTITDILKCFDEPFAGEVSSYFLAQVISQYVNVSLVGSGADELFGSDLTHRLAFPLANYPEYLKTGDLDLIRPFEENPDYLAQFAGDQDWEWQHKLLAYDDQEKASLYSVDFAEQMRTYSSLERLRHDFSDLTAVDPLNRVLEAEFKTYFPDHVLVFLDRLSMVHSLELRTAYLDTDFVEFVAGLPGNLKIRDGVTKYILKQAALRFFPPEMVHREKDSRFMPLTGWVLKDLEPYVRATLDASRLRKHHLFDVDYVTGVIDRLYHHEDRDYRLVNKMLTLLVFQQWYEMYISRDLIR